MLAGGGGSGDDIGEFWQDVRRQKANNVGPQNTSRQQHRSNSTRQEDRLKVYYTNCRSLRNKIDLLRGKVCVENFDIIAVTETWIDTNSKNFLSEFKIEGYELIHVDKKRKNYRMSG